jgi:biotin carboxylase
LRNHQAQVQGSLVQPKRVLLIATTTGYQTRSFGEAAERLGVEVALATDRCKTLDDPWRDRAVPIRFHDEPASVAAIVREAARTPFAGVLAVGDRPVAIAAQAAAALGLPQHPLDAARAAHNKRLSRERLRAAGLPVPWFAAYGLGDRRPLAAGEVPLPCVIKPLVLSGSRGVIRANTPAELAEAHARLVHLLQSRAVRALRDPDAGAVLIEGYIPGDEYAIEGLLEHGRLRVLAIFDKPDPLEGPFFEETIYVTPSRAGAARQRAIEAAVASAASALGLHHGPIHAECRVHGDRVFVLEVAARPIGGLCARALRFRDGATEISLEELLLRHALGEASGSWNRAAAASGVMMIPIRHRGVYRRVEGVEAARAVPHVTDIQITAKPDQMLLPLPEGASYLGFIFATADAPRVVEDALRTAHARLAFVIDRPLPIVSPSSSVPGRGSTT